MTFLLILYKTMGTEVYESETGPTIGHDNIETGFVIMPDDVFDGDTFDPENYRSVEVLAELDAGQVRMLHIELSKAVRQVGV